MISILTPTHDRPKAFALSESYMARQTYQGAIQWIVVCDKGIDGYRFTQGQEVIARDASNDKPGFPSMCYNYLAGATAIKADKVIIWEDDDWYSPGYLQFMVDALEHADMVGTAPAYYFHITARRWRNLKNEGHCSLAQTGFTLKALPTFEQCCKAGNIYVDAAMWCHYRLQGSQLLLPNDFGKPICVGIKGLPHGARGLGLGHDGNAGIRDIEQLRRWIGKDYFNYYDMERNALK